MEAGAAQQGVARYDVRNDRDVMRYALDVMQMLGKSGRVVLRGRGQAISNAVTISNIVTARLASGVYRVEDIRLDSEKPRAMGRVETIILITLARA